MPSARNLSPRVELDGVWKKFRKGSGHDSLRDLIPALVRVAVSGAWRAPVHRDEFWALKDVSFAVDGGSAMGIIGPNGAGKSTILKLLTRILKPTRGRCLLHGRVGALIELAAGFHPDLSGRENVYLQGAIMGMKRVEIARRFDQIVEFSGIPEFIDSPVKNYSSGMHARLGFAIAAHVDPEVLLIDEVLGVGDLAFQKRAMDRIEQLARRGLPVVIVSHQLERIATLCTTAIVLDRGEVLAAGTPSDCIEAYVRHQAFTEAGPSTCAMRLEGLERLGSQTVATGDHLTVVVTGTIPLDYAAGSEEIIMRVRSIETGQILFAIGKESFAAALPAAGPFAIEAELQMNVQPGMYLIETQVRSQTRTQYVGAGPQTHVQVKGGQTFYGMIQMNPRIIARGLGPLDLLTPAQDGGARPGRDGVLDDAAGAGEEIVAREHRDGS